MTVITSGEELGKKIAESIPGSVVSSDKTSVMVDSKTLLQVAEFLKTTPALDFSYLNFATAVDYMDYFELVYRVLSLEHNHSLILKTRCYGREDPSVPSVVAVWRGAYFQEREMFDMFGIKFEGHPDLRRLLTWEGFQGYPLRRDYL
ncbi:MAG: NADH-quinone oxidoreductase subunit C [Dehalococcoidia bacterium]